MEQSNIALIEACFDKKNENAINAIENKMAEINTRITYSVKKKNGGKEQINSSESTPIIIASAMNNISLVKELLKRNADITKRAKGKWIKNDHPREIEKGNALDVALYFSHADVVKILFLHAALHLNPQKQSELLNYMEEKNILLFVGKKYPQFMSKLVKEILDQNDITLTQQIMCDFASSHGATSELINEYLELFVSIEDLNYRKSTLETMQFDAHLDWFKALSSNKHANKLIKNLNEAKFKFLLDGDNDSFNTSVLNAIDDALPTLGKQAAWKVAIGHFLEALAVILPIISQKQIEFFKKTDASRKLESMRDQLNAIPSAPLAKGETIDIPEAVSVEAVAVVESHNELKG